MYNALHATYYTINRIYNVNINRYKYDQIITLPTQPGHIHTLASIQIIFGGGGGAKMRSPIVQTRGIWVWSVLPVWGSGSMSPEFFLKFCMKICTFVCVFNIVCLFFGGGWVGVKLLSPYYFYPSGSTLLQYTLCPKNAPNLKRYSSKL